ncbi:MAG TPA: transposase [Solirubrobacter sp.]|nr:transposase [Solirubrobacter sp.]
MPRPPRAEQPGGIFHVYSRGAVKQTIFLDNRDRATYLGALARVIHRTGWRCLSYCLMGTHMHLLIETPQPNLGRGMHLLHGWYAQVFNQRHGKSGHVFGARYGATSVTTDAQLWVTVRYIARNPVDAGFVKTAERWPWSSHAALAEGATPPCVDVARLLSYFRSMGGDPLRRYCELIATAEPERA